MTKEEAIKILRHWGSNTPATDRDCAVKMAIEALEKPEPHWTPVTERLPEAGESVLICDAYGDIYLGHRANYGYYFPDFCGDKIKDVRAWCELPEPFKGVTE